MGLAAPQVGILRRAVIVVPDPEKDEMVELVNPEIVAQEGEVDELRFFDADRLPENISPPSRRPLEHWLSKNHI